MSETNRRSKPTNVSVRKLPDDPVCPRVSAGGRAEPGFYITYRGSLQEAYDVLIATAAAVEQLLEQRPQG